MAREKTVYAVSSNTDPAAPPTLVRAWSRAQAQRHVARSHFTTTLATPEDGVRLGRAGRDIEDATAEDDKDDEKETDDDAGSTSGTTTPDPGKHVAAGVVHEHEGQ